jgi:hypothetical protein
MQQNLLASLIITLGTSDTALRFLKSPCKGNVMSPLTLAHQSPTHTHTHTHTNANDAKAYKIHASTRGKCMPHVHKLAHTCTLEHACYYTHTHTHVHTWMSGSASMTSGARFLAYHGCIEVCDMLRIGQNRIYTVCDCRFGE